MKAGLLDYVRKALHTLEKPIDATTLAVKRRFNLFEPVKVLAYRGFGNPRGVKLTGRVLEDREIGSATNDDPWWQNARAMTRRFMTYELAGVRVRASFLGEATEVTTDNDGYFEVRMAPPRPPRTEAVWHDLELRLLDRVTDEDRVTSTGKILIPPASASFGVISDVDDTILKSSATDLFRMAKLTFFNNAYTRTPFPKVAKFYRALEKGRDGSGPNPIFYVSSSAWNLYDLLEDFMRVHGIPSGPILLRDVGIDSNKLIKSGHDHKLDKIRDIFEYCPDLPFILIGDSGQRDPWLYREVARRYPGRIAAIYIRDIATRKREQVQEIAEELRRDGLEMLLVKDADEAARHALARGFVSDESAAELKQAS